MHTNIRTYILSKCRYPFMDNVPEEVPVVHPQTVLACHGTSGLRDYAPFQGTE